MTLHAHAIAQVTPSLTGIHLLWNGPHTWVYSPAGWTIERRVFDRRFPLDCLSLTPEELARLRERRELGIRFGTLTDRVDRCPVALVAPPAPTGPTTHPTQPTQPTPPAHTPPTTHPTVPAPHVPPVIITRAANTSVCEVITLELLVPQGFVRVSTQATMSFVVALRDGKAVAGGQMLPGSAVHDLWAQGIDTVVVYARGLTALTYCLRRKGSDDDWREATTIAKVQLPLRELMPELADADAEFAEAKRRLLPGDVIDRGEFERLADTLRRIVTAVGPPRPIDLALLLRDDPDVTVDELSALDPVAALLPHPTWRRVLGFAYVDRDPALVPGLLYEYRITGAWPAGDLVDRVYGFHTIPSTTPVPRECYLHDLRLRLPDPTTVERHDTPDAAFALTRRGITLTPDRESFWLGPDLDGWSLVIDFPTAVSAVVLELGDAAHTLSFAAGAAWMPPGIAQPVPPGQSPRLDFATPIHQLRLAGKAFLCAIRVIAEPASQLGLRRQSAIIPPTVLADTPLPASPLSATVANLQAPAVIVPNDVPATTPPPQHALGFEVCWIPAPIGGAIAWPPALPPPPTESTLFQVEHSRADVNPPAWMPLLDAENYMTGHRATDASAAPLGLGLDLMQSFPEVRQPDPNGDVTLLWRDVFDFKEAGGPERRPLPPPGTLHRYRVRAVDAIGRTSSTWTETGVARLEKWVPPPPAAGPDPTKADALTRPAPTGVQARVLIKDAPDLTDHDRDLLGTHQNAIVLRWGWHASQRDQDPFAREFRVYATRRRLDSARGTIDTVVSQQNGLYSANLTIDETVAAQASTGLRLDAGYPFEIASHGAAAPGVPTTVMLRARVTQAGALPEPRAGDVRFPLRFTPDRTRAPWWGPRVAVQPITSAAVYESAPIFDLLHIDADHPRDEALVGVSVADDQPYVPDPLGAGRPGNEGAISAVPVQGRWFGRPVVVDGPALDEVPAIVMREPAARPMRTMVDLTPLLPGSGLGGNERVRLERVSADDVFRAYRVDAGRLVGRVLLPAQPGDIEHDVTVPNSGDRAAILAAIGGGDTRALLDRFAVFLAASHPYKSRLFAPTGGDVITLPRVDDTFPNTASRWIYRVRLADAAGHLSADGITLRGIVRVPTTTELPVPRRLQALDGDPANRLRVAIGGPAAVTHVLVFSQALPRGAEVTPAADLLRVPSATRMAPGDGVRLRLADATLLAPDVAPLDGSNVEGLAPTRTLTLDVPAQAGDIVRVWIAAMTVDGVTSPLGGSWTLRMPLPPLQPPSLSLAPTGTQVVLSWTWTLPAEALGVFVEAAPLDVETWTRISPVLAADIATLSLDARPREQRFRLRASTDDGRTVTSNEVTR